MFLLSFSDFKYHNREPFDCGGHDIDVCFPTGPTQNHILLFIKFFIYLCFCLFFFTHTIFLFFLEEKRKKPKYSNNNEGEFSAIEYIINK